MKSRKVFTVYGQGSKVVRRALIERGWFEKVPRNKRYYKIWQRPEQSFLSNFLEKYDANFIWGRNSSNEIESVKAVKTKTKTIYPIRNTLEVVNNWSTKYGIFLSLKNSYWHYIDNVAEVIAPRTFSNANNYEIKDFIKDYHLTACTSLLRWIVETLQNNKPVYHETGRISMNVIVFAINRCKEFVYMKEHKDIDINIINKVAKKDWDTFLKEYRSLVDGKDLFQIDVGRSVFYLLHCAKYVLDCILMYRPQLNCEGFYNIWIVKPSEYSRGRGIVISSKLNCIMDIINKTNQKYVVQKYIGKKSVYDITKFVIICFVVSLLLVMFFFSEKPLLIYDTKFDIRQHYLVTSTYPLVIWMYKDCYLKFSSKTYTLNNLHKAIHLTNHSVQKHYKNSAERHPELPNSNMWTLYKYKCYLNEIGKQNVWDNVVYPSMRKAIIGIMLSSQPSLATSNNRFELFGCDFILDNDFTPWLIEINTRPDLGSTSEVTANICPQVVADIIKGIVSNMFIILMKFSI